MASLNRAGLVSLNRFHLGPPDFLQKEELRYSLLATCYALRWRAQAIGRLRYGVFLELRAVPGLLGDIQSFLFIIQD